MPKSSTDAVSRLPDRTRLRWSREEADAVVAAFEASGLPIEKFAEGEGLKPARLARWQRKLKMGRAPTGPKFVELRPAPSKPEPTRIELVLRSGHVLFVSGSFDPASLRRILELLERDTGC